MLFYIMLHYFLMLLILFFILVCRRLLRLVHPKSFLVAIELIYSKQPLLHYFPEVSKLTHERVENMIKKISLVSHKKFAVVSLLVMLITDWIL